MQTYSLERVEPPTRTPVGLSKLFACRSFDLVDQTIPHTRKNLYLDCAFKHGLTLIQLNGAIGLELPYLLDQHSCLERSVAYTMFRWSAVKA